MFLDIKLVELLEEVFGCNCFGLSVRFFDFDQHRKEVNEKSGCIFRSMLSYTLNVTMMSITSGRVRGRVKTQKVF